MVVRPVASLDRLRERHLVAGAERNLLQRRDAARGRVDPVDAALLQFLREFDGLRAGPSRPRPSRSRRRAMPTGLSCRKRRAHRVEHFERKAHAVLQASRHIGRCAGWRSATGTDAADSRARSAPRWRRCRAARRAWRRPRRRRARAASPAASNASGGVSPSLCGIADGPSVRQPPSATGINCPPSHGVWLDALRPACASWIITAAFERLRTEARIGFSAASVASL